MLPNPLTSMRIALSVIVTSIAWSILAAPPATQPDTDPLRATDIAGIQHALSNVPEAKATAVIFLSTQCPISNKYIPELNRLAQTHANDGVRIFAVLSDPSLTREAAQKYVAEFQIKFSVLFDASGELAARLRPTVTPEAFALDRFGAVQYRGRIDNLWADLRKQKVEATTHELTDALASIASGNKPSVNKAPPVGCFFEAWNAPAASAKVTYARDVAPILNSNCVQCHRTGEIAPFSLSSYSDAAKHARQMTRVTGEHLMPPWKAEPGFGHFADERRLTSHEIATLAAWASGGTPEGNPADLPPPPQLKSEWTLGEPDVVLTMPQAFNIPAAGRDVYRVFSLPIDLPKDRYVIAFQFKPGATTVVHHALFYLDDKHEARTQAAAATDGLPGYHSFGGIGFRPSGGIGGWAPGVMPYFLPDGIGKPIHAGTDVVIQLHYHPDGKPHQDTSKLALYFAKKPITQTAASFMVINNKIDIPAGENHYTRTAQVGPIPADVTLLGITPHMHLVGKQMKVIATKPDGTVTPLINITDWDFRWQDQYRYAEPVKLPKGTVVSLEAVYDNSVANTDNPNSPPKRVVHGEQTTNEMCICFLQYTVDKPSPFAGLRKLFAK